MAAGSDDPHSYQQQLRALGAYLDQQEHHRFRFIQERESYLVELERVGIRSELRTERFPFTNLAEHADALVQGRRPFGKGHARPWRLATTDREDVMRALGWELDDSGAGGLAVDELDDGLLVTYSYLDPSKGYDWRKRMIVFRQPEIMELLEAAYSRRNRKGFLGLRRR